MARYIDADALLKKFDDVGIQNIFDLPVEEILGEEVDLDDFAMLVQDAIQAYRKMAIDTIKNQPTAYDVDAVVAELEKAESVKNFGSRNSGNLLIPLKDAIKIVRNAGKDGAEDKKYNADGELNHAVDDEVIEWQPLPSTPYRKGE